MSTKSELQNQIAALEQQKQRLEDQKRRELQQYAGAFFFSNISSQITAPFNVQIAALNTQIAALQAQIAAIEAQEELERKQQQQRELRRQIMSSGPLTRGGVVPARIYEVDEHGYAVIGSEHDVVHCMFNPYKYKVQKKNSINVKGIREDKSYTVEFDQSKVDPRKLSMNLWFDTYETGEDVRQITDKFLNYAEVQAGYMMDFASATSGINAPPKVAFEWGTFRFLAVIKTLNFKFTLFDPTGKPLRAKASVQFQEFKPRNVYPNQNPTSGTKTREHTWKVAAGDRLDTIAAEVYGDAAQWRLIARRNRIVNPLAIHPGQELTIPPMRQVR